MLAKVILVHGVIGYKFCWLLPEDQNQGPPAGHESAETPIGNESIHKKSNDKCNKLSYKRQPEVIDEWVLSAP